MSTPPCSTEQLNATPRNPYAELMILAGPIIAMMVSRLAMNFIDFVMVSRLGTEAQAAIGPASLLAFLFAYGGMGVVIAVQTFVAQADGRGRPKEGAAYVRQSLYIVLAMTLLSIPLALTTDAWMTAIGVLGRHDANVVPLEIEYLRYAVLMIGPATLAASLEAFFNGVQKPGVPLLAVVISTLVNIVGNYALIFGHFGFPALGVGGAAIATVIGWMARAAVLAAFFLAPRTHRRFATYGSLKPSRPHLSGLLYVGLPTALHWMIDLGSWSVFTMLIISTYDKVAMAATNIVIQYTHLAFMPALGVGVALTSQIGVTIGRGDHRAAQMRVRTALVVTCAYMGAIGVMMLCAGRPLMQLLTEDAAVVEVGVVLMVLAALYQVTDAMQIVYIGALRGAGDTRFPAILTGVATWGLLVGGGLLISRFLHHLGPAVPWSMATLYIAICGVGLCLRWRRGSWRKIRLFGGNAPEAAEAQPCTSCETPAAD